MAYVPLTDQDSEMEMHHPQSWVGKYAWSQDHKVIAIQYGSIAIFTGVVGMMLSMLFRLQLGFPESVDFVDPSFYYQSVTLHGMIMVIYLLTALF
ncbi:MAG: cbb3-type cytochrome c oxidase subunit I, partial [Gammaproteobacteria bacterium]|nr:cbb3-type cytochrome c oxidase subunit I [Gammaproteobacteria bacterium]